MRRLLNPLRLACWLLSASAAMGGASADWIYRLDLSPADHARAADSLRDEGFRPISLDAFGEPGNPRMVSAWIRETGPEWMLLQGLDEQPWRDSLRALGRKGFQPAVLCALPADHAAMFASILEKDPTPAVARTGLSLRRFQEECDSARRTGSLLTWMDAYGTPAQPLFAGIWKANSSGIAWNYSLGDDEASLQSKLRAFSRVWVRPAFLAPIPGGKLFTLWHENSIGPWSVLPALDGDSCRPALARAAARGQFPLCLSGTAAGERKLFTALLAGRRDPLPRHWTVTGPSAPQLSAFDAYMRTLMQTYQVRAGALAMVHDAKLVFAHGYTWAEEGYPHTRPNSMFRVASCSKPLTSMVVHKLLQDGRAGGFSLEEKALSLLPPPARGDSLAPADARFRDITVDDLLTHSGGWIRSRENPDPVFNDFPPGHAIDRRLPGGRDGFLPYMLGQPLQYAPGSRSVYANFGYFLLGRIIESLPPGRGRSYEKAVEELLFKPLGLHRPRFGNDGLPGRDTGEVMYHTRIPYLQRNRDPAGPPWIPGGYGDFNLRNMDAAGAWVLAATDYAKVLASFDLGAGNPVLKPEAVATMWAPPRHAKYMRGWFSTRIARAAGQAPFAAKWHSGLYPGTSTLIFYRPDKWSFALFLNQDIPPQLSGEKQGRELSRLADQVAVWPARDLFPDMGIIPFRPALLAGGG